MRKFSLQDIFKLSSKNLDDEWQNLTTREKRALMTRFFYDTAQLLVEENNYINSISFFQSMKDSHNYAEFIKKENNIDPFKDNILTMDIVSYYNNFPPPGKKYTKIQLKQIELEQKLIQEYTDDALNEKIVIRKVIDKLPKQNNSYFCQDVVNDLTTLLTTLFNNETQLETYVTDVKEYKNPNENEKNFFTFKIKNRPFNFMLKYQVIDDDGEMPKYYRLIHEGIVGLFGTNKLIEKIPNFAPIYCIKENGPANNFFPNPEKENRVYIIYDFVTNTIPFSQFLKTCTLSQYMNYYIQILMALNLADDEIGFTHYDLHTENVILRDIPNMKEFYIKYGNVYIKTDKIITVIDYELSHIYYEKKSYGSLSNFEMLGIERDDNKIIFDVYKCLLNNIYFMKKEGNKIYSQLEYLVYFFNKNESLEYIIGNQDQVYYLLGDNGNNFNFDEYFQYVQRFITYQGIPNPLVRKVSKDDIVINCTS